MITKKDLVVSILCTFCLTTVLLTMMPVQSAEWDPWVDVKEDGTINVLDLIKVAGSLGTSGDTTKNVNVTNWPNWWMSNRCNITNWPVDEQGNLKVRIEDKLSPLNLSLGIRTLEAHSSWETSYTSVEGYASFYVYLMAWSSSPWITIDVGNIFGAGGIEARTDTYSITSAVWGNPSIFGPFNVRGPQFKIIFGNPGDHSVTMHVGIYVMP